ncbi:hypothetical protein [Amycolatopsis minnesotensis]|uniref:hypothetical protein n=1 Tax=Amycolatopsis minnesotensis TaxID=337894 RepID=UPI0031CEA3A2
MGDVTSAELTDVLQQLVQTLRITEARTELCVSTVSEIDAELGQALRTVVADLRFGCVSVATLADFYHRALPPHQRSARPWRGRE